jgi:RNA polymerase sigma-70 factor, ECF subfamily
MSNDRSARPGSVAGLKIVANEHVGGAPASVLHADEFEALYREQLSPIYNYVRYRVGEADAADVTADSFAKAWAGRRSYDGERGTPVAWLWGIVRNTVVDRRARHQADAFRPPFDVLPTSTEGSLDGQLWPFEELVSAINTLNDLDQEIVSLRFAAGHTNRSIAAMLGLTEANVAQRLKRALGRLRAALLEGG